MQGSKGGQNKNACIVCMPLLYIGLADLAKPGSCEEVTRSKKWGQIQNVERMTRFDGYLSGFLSQHSITLFSGIFLPLYTFMTLFSIWEDRERPWHGFLLHIPCSLANLHENRIVKLKGRSRTYWKRQCFGIDISRKLFAFKHTDRLPSPRLPDSSELEKTNTGKSWKILVERKFWELVTPSWHFLEPREGICSKCWRKKFSLLILRHPRIGMFFKAKFCLEHLFHSVRQKEWQARRVSVKKSRGKSISQSGKCRRHKIQTWRVCISFATYFPTLTSAGFWTR